MATGKYCINGDTCKYIHSDDLVEIVLTKLDIPGKDYSLGFKVVRMDERLRTSDIKTTGTIFSNNRGSINSASSPELIGYIPSNASSPVMQIYLHGCLSKEDAVEKVNHYSHSRVRDAMFDATIALLVDWLTARGGRLEILLNMGAGETMIKKEDKDVKPSGIEIPSGCSYRHIDDLVDVTFYKEDSPTQAPALLYRVSNTRESLRCVDMAAECSTKTLFKNARGVIESGMGPNILMYGGVLTILLWGKDRSKDNQTCRRIFDNEADRDHFMHEALQLLSEWACSRGVVCTSTKEPPIMNPTGYTPLIEEQPAKVVQSTLKVETTPGAPVETDDDKAVAQLRKSLERELTIARNRVDMLDSMLELVGDVRGVLASLAEPKRGTIEKEKV